MGMYTHGRTSKRTHTSTHYLPMQLALMRARAVLVDAGGMDELVACKPELGDKPTALFF